MKKSLLFAVFLAMSAPVFSGDTITEYKDEFESAGKKIGVERFEPTAPGKCAAVLMLHGSEGLSIGEGFYYKDAARKFARDGYAVMIVNYFERSGTKFADLMADLKFFSTWMETVKDAITYAGAQPNIDSSRIGIYGVSLGSYLALAVATQEPRISAVVDNFGGLSDPFAKSMKKMPPVLILHGDRDLLVSVKEAYKLEALLKEKKLPYEIKIYEGQGHGILGKDAEDAFLRTLQFFDRYLKRAKAQ